MSKIKYNEKNFGFNRFYIYCWWLWILSILSVINLIPFSFFNVTIITFTFSFLNFVINSKVYYKKRIIIFISEFLLLFINFVKHFLIDKKPLLYIPDIIFTIFTIFIYLVFLNISKLNFYDVYFGDVSKNASKKKTFISSIKQFLFTGCVSC